MQAIGAIIYIAVLVIELITIWTLFSRAGKPGWACLIPIYNIIVFLEIAKKPAWWVILFFIPVVNIVVMIMALANFLKAFGKEGAGPVVLTILFGGIYLPVITLVQKVEYVGLPEEN